MDDTCSELPQLDLGRRPISQIEEAVRGRQDVSLVYQTPGADGPSYRYRERESIFEMQLHWISVSTWDLGLEQIHPISDFAL